MPLTNVTTALNQKIAFVNVGGLVLYTDVFDATKDLLAVTSVALAQKFYAEIGSRGLIGAAARIGALVNVRPSLDGARLSGGVSIAGLIAVVGGFAL